MQPQMQAVLQAYGMEITKTLSRFSGNESMMLMFLGEFPDDPSMADAVKARERGDDAAFQEAIHSLKGMSGSLGLIPLYTPCAALMDALRAGDSALSARLYPNVLTQYDRAIAAIREAGL